MKTEYQVRPVTRYIVTRYEQATTKDELFNGPSQSSVVGEFASGQQADLVACAMAVCDRADGIESSRTRHGLSLGEVISGQRIEGEV
ncbi:hypothetical protein [Pseudomonas sp. UBA2047]|uniref:hypothetical protein n=1 Tax=Pseudomonas sp. UBA2047 TaxID=1947306 RepID=UPI00257EBC42|nr:hypothetical protein [Pseudomonas sp. UBA2047]